MNRRDALLVLLALSAAPLGGNAQQASKRYRIGLLERISAQQNASNFDGFRQGLREFGYVEGRNLEFVYRSSDGRDERLAGLAEELVRLKVDLILTRGTPASLAAKAATGTIPIVVASAADPVGVGIVADLAHPGGNVTGLSAFNTALYPKRVELLKELIPKLARIAALLDMSNPVQQRAWKEIDAAGRTLGVVPQLLDVRRVEDIGLAFSAAAKQRADAVLVSLDGVMLANSRTVIELAAKHRLPAMYASKEFVEADGLISFGVSYAELYRQAAKFVDKIFKGAKPGDLPVEQPTKFEMFVNRRTAKALGLTIPQSVLLRADRVIE